MAMALRPPRARSAWTDSSSTSVTQSHMTLPSAVWAISARWPMAIGGRVAIWSRPGSSSSTVLWRASATSSSRVVHCCPFQPTYWRSSSQIGHWPGGVSDGAYWTPHVRQMKAGTFSWASAARLGAFAPAVWLAHFVAGDESAATAATAQAAAIVAHGPGRGRAHNAAVFEDAGHCAAHEAVQLEADRRSPSGRRGL